MKKRYWSAVGMTLFLAVTGGLLSIRAGQLSAERTVIAAKYVAVPNYTGRNFTGIKSQAVDEAYMDNLMSEMLTAYNEIRGTGYDVWTDEQVKYTTQGMYTKEADWRAYLQEKYAEIEKQYAKDDTAQMILSEIVSESELLGYNELDYADMEASVIGQLIYGNGFASEEEMVKSLELSEEEYQNMVEEYTLQSLKIDYVTEAIAEAEDLQPSEAELEAAKKEHMEGVLEMGYTEDDDYYKEELEHWENEEDDYRLFLMAEAVKDFLYEHNHIS